MNRRTALLLAALALTAVSPSCDGGSGDGDTNPDQVCDPGSEVFCRPCEGNPDVTGTKTCNESGSGFDECVPSGGSCPIIDCAPGETRFCKCDGGEGGEQICNDDGTGYTACECTGGVTCEPGEKLFCTCDGGEAGEKVCNGEGNGFAECDCGGAGGSGGGGAGGGGGGGRKPVRATCIQDDECESGSCPMGYCTKACAEVADCPFGAAECVTFDNASFCMPTCKDQSECDVYGPPIECGYAQAIDAFPVTTCADWLGALELPPDGNACADDLECNLGHEGQERVCAFEACTTGCYEQKDCPASKECSSTGALGNCQ